MTETTVLLDFISLNFGHLVQWPVLRPVRMLGPQQGMQMAEFHVSMAWML